MKKVRWGMLGCGDVAEIKSGPGFQKAAGSQLIAVMRRNGKLAEDYSIRHNVPKWYDDANELINDPNIDAVYIASPPSSHKKYTLAVAKAGKPVYVEKPMALNYSECVEMVKTCEDANVPLFTAYYRRALPRFAKIKSLIDDGAIGEVRFVNIQFSKPPSESDKNRIYNWRVDPSIAGCGYFCDLGSHMIDLLQYYLGPIISAEGYSTNQGKFYSAEDLISALFKFESGVQGAGNWCFTSDDDLDQTGIVGSEGKIIYSTFTDSPIVLIRKGKAEEFYVKHPEHVAQPLIQNVVDELLGIGKSPSTGRSGASTSWVLDKILGRL
ncbi:MAG: Gfo/Idh/MocA family oxidoreductase [Ignavibacteriales bacterium]|nr:Gfo/Idh/MocA family oxidoreductase [Ignavibacteriales bacterium]